MATDNSRPSFFDDDDLKLVFEFKKPEAKHQSDLSAPATLSNVLLRTSHNGTQIAQGLYCLHNNIVAFYKDNFSTQPDAILELPHSRLHSLPPSLSTANYGFSLTRNGNKYEFFSPDEQVIENWKNALKSACVLTNFHDEYKAQKMIGKGSFAKVYLVESKTTGKTYAVKAFTKESVIIANKANAKPCMLNEIDIMRALDHDNVIRLYEVYETEKSIYFVLALIQGKSLQELLKKQAFKDNEARVINILAKLLEAIGYLSSRGVMHRDLKPDNILVDKFDNISIVDFGLATFIHVPEYIFKKCGTPGYIAPEVFKYDQKNPATAYDGHCDVFSVGCIMFYMLFGIPFFDGSNASEILKVNRRFTTEFNNLLLVNQEYNNPSSKHSKEALNLLLQLLQFDQKLRVSATEALNHSYLLSASKRPPSYYDLPSGNSSPNFFDKRGSFAQELYLQQLKTGTTLGSASPVRFTEKDSLYLDVGRPEITGRIDTITGSSANNSMALMSRATSTVDNSPLSSSPYGRNPAHSHSCKLQSPADPYRSSLFRNQGIEGEQDSGTLRLKLEEVRVEKRPSEFTTPTYPNYGNPLPPTIASTTVNPYMRMDESSHIAYENMQIQNNMEKLKLTGQPLNSSKMVESPGKKYLLNNQGQKYYDKDV